jgi:hypothetical protein
LRHGKLGELAYGGFHPVVPHLTGDDKMRADVSMLSKRIKQVGLPYVAPSAIMIGRHGRYPENMYHR